MYISQASRKCAHSRLLPAALGTRDPKNSANKMYLSSTAEDSYWKYVVCHHKSLQKHSVEIVREEAVRRPMNGHMKRRHSDLEETTMDGKLQANRITLFNRCHVKWFRSSALQGCHSYHCIKWMQILQKSLLWLDSAPPTRNRQWWEVVHVRVQKYYGTEP